MVADEGATGAAEIWDKTVKLEGVGIEEDSGFGIPGWSRCPYIRPTKRK